MMTKEQLVKLLKNVKVVLGNGADLYCGLKTRYSDFFETRLNKYQFIRDAYEQFKKKSDYGVDDFYVFAHDLQIMYGWKPLINVNIWDVLFYLNGKNDIEGILWCDIEMIMHNSFVKYSKSGDAGFGNYSHVHWDNVKAILDNTKELNSKNEYDVFAAVFSYMIHKNKFSARHFDFYSFLKEQLLEFENDFGLYIKDSVEKEISLEEKRYKLLEHLVNIKEISSVETFNYSPFEVMKANCYATHINGTTKSPIFGIDESFEDSSNGFLNDEAKNYLKTSRRIDLDLIDDNIEELKEFDNVVVFGHSLNKQDYSYFYPLLDKIRISDILCNSRFVIAYNIYDYSKEDEIRKNIKNNLIKLFASYEKEHLGFKDARLLDYLTTQKRVILYRIA